MPAIETRSSPANTPKNSEFVANELVPALTRVPDHLPKKNGKKVHRSSVARWLTKGCDGVRLRGWKAGRTWMTTPAAAAAFTAALAEKAAGESAGPAPRAGVADVPPAAPPRPPPNSTPSVSEHRSKPHPRPVGTPGGGGAAVPRTWTSR